MLKRGRPPKNRKSGFDLFEDDSDKRKNTIKNLNNSIESVLSEINSMPKDYMAPSDLLPGISFDYINYDYDRDIETIKEDAKETLECVSSLYLNKDITKKKNIMTIIKNDSETISDIKFSLSCAKRGLINCMKQLDAGSNDPEMHQAVNAYQKEIRDSSKMINDLLTKMKSFYKELRDEYERKEINETKSVEIEKKSDNLVIFDSKKMNKMIDDYKNDPTLLSEIFGNQDK